MRNGLNGKVAVVTGSTSGIGLGIAQVLAGQGADIMLNGFGDAAAIDKTRGELARQHNVKVSYNGADLSKPDQIAAMIAATEKEFGKCDILVNNAGIQYTAAVDEFPPEKWDQILQINLTGCFHAIRAALPG
jgi:3-hydroxybutyrate dehydrogenase